MSGNHKFNRRSKSDSRGQSLIELVLLLPLLLVLIVGALEVGRLFFTKMVITNAAREGAYCFSVNPGEYGTATAAAVAEAANSGVSDIVVIPVLKDFGSYSSIEITVQTTVNNLLVLGLIGGAFTATNFAAFPITSTVEMMVQ